MSIKVSWKRTLWFYTKLVSLGSAAGYSYLHFRCKRLREEILNDELISLKKDTTRPSNEYYGLNWGYRADNSIEKSLDTGDLLFFNYHCGSCLSPSSVVKCYAQQALYGEEAYQNVAFCFRTPHKLFVVSD